MTLEEFNALPVADAAAALHACAASGRWVDGLVARRPYASHDDLFNTAGFLWCELGPNDWREAMDAHPRIGDGAPRHADARSAAWSAGEQMGVRDEDRLALVRANREYEAQFGHLFLICATGKRSDEILAALYKRMKNTPDVELAVAGEELGKIARLRLEKLLGFPSNEVLRA
ncbi:MAG: 2-oxo-4-hydroxy-4-carboxy-5-ureidoimidazoline decarboxylase [Gemmatimonadota bacterium]